MLVESSEDIIAIDCGLSFPEEDMPGVDLVVPTSRTSLNGKTAFEQSFLLMDMKTTWARFHTCSRMSTSPYMALG